MSSHALATVLVTSFSKKIPPLVRFSTFNKTLAPTLGEKTFIRKTLLVEKSMLPPTVNKVPAQTSGAFFTMRPTLAEVLIPLICGFGILVAVAPPKLVNA